MERVLRNLQQSKLAIVNGVPNILEMQDGQLMIAKETNKNPKLYIKIGSKVYINEFKELTKGS
tara:strand:+ start:1746 stop:1934 length:189 start_codon:yes stop_codon:yes gene_type:complete